MAVTTETLRASYAGNDVTVAFAVPFLFHDDAALRVIVRSATGVETLKVISTHYTVTGVDNPLGGTVTMLAAPATGETLFILHRPHRLQPLDLSSGSAFPAATFEEQLDREVHMIQAIGEEVERTPRLPDTDTDGAGAYDANGNRLGNLADPASGQDAVTRAYALANFATASGPAAIPPANSIGDTEFDATDPLTLAKIKGLTVAEQQVETNPLALALDASHLVAHQKLQYQILAILNNLDAGARAHAFEAVGTNVPTQIAAQIAAAIQGSTELLNGSLLVSQRFPSESATGTIATGVDAYVCDEVFVMPTGGTVTWARVSAGLHSTAISPLGLEFTGAAGMTNMRVGWRLGRRWCRRMGALLANKNVTFGVKVRHSGTTGSITPNLLVRSTSNTGDDSVSTKFATANMTTRLTQAFPGALAAGNEVAFTHTFDLGAMTDSQNGIEVYVDLLAMNAATIKFTVTDFWSAPGDISSSLRVDDFSETLERCAEGFDKTADYATSVASLAAGTAGFAGTLVGHGAVSPLISGLHWNHRRAGRFAGTLTTYNPSVAAATPRNTLGDNGTISSIQAGERNSYVRYVAAGSERNAWHIHATRDASFYD